MPMPRRRASHSYVAATHQSRHARIELLEGIAHHRGRNTMGRVRNLKVKNYRSIKDEAEVRFPSKAPLVLVGPNNAGKSNLVRALDLVLGESWPGTYEPEDHDFHGRDRNNKPLRVIVEVEGVVHESRYGPKEVARFELRCPPDDDEGRPLTMYFRSGGSSSYVSNETREQCMCILISADRRLAYQLSYASKYTFLSKLMRRFHDALTKDEPRVQELKKKFAEIKVLFGGVQEFSTFARELQTQVAELSGNFEYQLGVDFSAYDPSNYFHALRVLPQQAGQVRTFAELGTGQEQVLAISFAYAYAKAFHGEEKGLILVIEEPESHLHPLAQRWVAHKVYELAMEGLQVVITTHSPAFLNMLNLDGLALVRKEGMATSVVQLTPQQLVERCRAKGATKATEETILPFYAAAATEEILSGFFARKVVLVEGPTEALALPVYLGRVGLDTEKEGVAIIPVHGVGNLAKWWRLFSSYGIPTYPIFDNDSKDDKDGTKRSDLLATLGVESSKLDQIVKSTNMIVERAYAVFGVNFEETLRQVFGSDYPKLEEEAATKFGLSREQSKPLVARHVAERIALPDESKASQRFTELKDSILQANA